MHVRQVVSDPKARLKPCLRCERSLLKHLDDRFCPDCGLSVWMSLNSNDALDRSRAHWLRRAAQGAWILAAAQPLALAAYLVGFVGHELPSYRAMMIEGAEEDYADWASTTQAQAAAASTQAAGTASEMSPQTQAMIQAMSAPSVAVAIALCLIGAYFVVAAVALFRLAADERRYPDRQKTHRLAAQIVAAISGVVGVATLALGTLHLAGGFPSHTAVAWLLLVAIEITFAATAVVTWLYLRPIARRGGRSTLAKLCGWLLLLPLLAFAKAAPFIGLWFLYLLMPLATLLPLAYLPLSTVLLVKFARMLSRAAPHAEAAWAAESKPADYVPVASVV